MRLSLVAGWLVLAGAAVAYGDPDTEKMSDRIARLVADLGHPQFARRESASRELVAIGEPALDALRQSAAGGDAEVRARAERLIQLISKPMRAAAAKKELARWQGEWFGDREQRMTIKGDKWVSGTPTFGPISGTLANIEVGEKATMVDLVVEAGPTKGQICRAIFRLDGETLNYCGSYSAKRPEEFRSEGNNVDIAWNRTKPAPPPPPPPPPPEDIELQCEPFSTDLPLAESRTPIHRVLLNCRLTDGGAGTLTLDPNAPRFDEFGQAVADGKRQPVVALECTLKLVKKEAGLSRYEIRGPKIVSRLVLVTGPDIHGRLLVLAADGTVGRLINLHPVRNFPPCHPGCFPAGTPVQTPRGEKAIETIHVGDRVTTREADGKVSSCAVTSIFKTRNRLVEVRVEGGRLITTETQPLALDAGGFRAAGELKAGDRIGQWVDGKRRVVVVRGVVPMKQEANVFNLVLGETKVFVAGGFLVRSKPPADVVAP